MTVPLLLAAWAGACAGPAEGASVLIDARPLSREAARGESVAAVESGRGAIAVRRSLRAPDPCRTLAAQLDDAGERLTLRVFAEPDGRACRAAESYFAYTARIAELPPGRYDLRVVHAEGAASGEEDSVLVMERSVQVP